MVDLNKKLASSFNPNLLSDVEPDCNRHPNLSSSVYKPLTFQFVAPNCLSLINWHSTKKCLSWEKNFECNRQMKVACAFLQLFNYLGNLQLFLHLYFCLGLLEERFGQFYANH